MRWPKMDTRGMRLHNRRATDGAAQAPCKRRVIAGGVSAESVREASLTLHLAPSSFSRPQGSPSRPPQPPFREPVHILPLISPVLPPRTAHLFPDSSPHSNHGRCLLSTPSAPAPRLPPRHLWKLTLLFQPIDFDGEVNLFHFILLRCVGKGAFGKVRFSTPITRPSYLILAAPRSALSNTSRLGSSMRSSTSTRRNV